MWLFCQLNRSFSFARVILTSIPSGRILSAQVFMSLLMAMAGLMSNSEINYDTPVRIVSAKVHIANPLLLVESHSRAKSSKR